MAYPRDVKDTFEKLISDNHKVIGKVDETLRETARLQGEAGSKYDSLVKAMASRVVNPIDSAVLRTLSEIDGRINLEGDYLARVQASRAAQASLETMTLHEGNLAFVARGIVELEKRAAGLRAQADAQQENLQKMDNLVLRDVNAFNAKYGARGKQPVKTQEDIEYFSSKSGFSHVMAVLFDGHYRKGRKLIAGFTDKTIPELFEQRAGYAAAEADLRQQASDTEAKKADRLRVQAEMRSLSEAVVSDSSLKADLSDRIVLLMKDKKYFDRAALFLPALVGEEMVETRAKMESYAKIDRGLGAQKSALQKVNSKLDAPMSKLRRAVSNGVRKDIKVDLGQIGKAVKAQQVMATHAAVEMKKAAQKVQTFNRTKAPKLPAAAQMPVPSAQSPAYYNGGYSPTDMMMTWMVFSMLSTDTSSPAAALSALDAPDAQAVGSVLGISPAIADAAQIDLSSLTPSFSAEVGQALDGLSGDFNISAGALESLTQDLSFNTSSLDSFSVPDIQVSVPDISIDTGSFSSFDSGGSFGGGGGDF